MHESLYRDGLSGILVQTASCLKCNRTIATNVVSHGKVRLLAAVYHAVRSGKPASKASCFDKIFAGRSRFRSMDLFDR